MRSIVVAVLATLLAASPTLAAKHSAEVTQVAQAIQAGQIDPNVFDPEFVHFECGNDKSKVPRDLMDTHRQLRSRSYTGSPIAKRAEALKQLVRRANPIMIPTYFHLVTSTAKADSIPTSMWQAQLGAMNKAYANSGFQFRLAGTTKTVNDQWAVSADPKPMQQALRKGGYSTLNVYFLSDLSGSILGQCSMPTQTPPNAQPAQFFNDGCLIHAGTMPSAAIRGYNMGMTAVHETGHWMGLLHTFEGYSCSGDGDQIADTPAQSTSTSGCPAAKDSCPDVAGLDAVHNYMDYSTDACYESFSNGQIARINDLWNLYRKDFFDSDPSNDPNPAVETPSRNTVGQIIAPVAPVAPAIDQTLPPT